MDCSFPNFYPPIGGGADPVDIGAVVALPQNLADYGQAINQLIHGVAEGPYGAVLIPPRAVPYPVRTPIRYGPVAHTGCAPLRLFGQGATLRAVFPMEAMFRLVGSASTSTVWIDGLTLDCAGEACYGVVASSINQRTSVFSSIRVCGARRSGFWVRGCQAAVFRHCESVGNAADGWLVEGAFATRLETCVASSNGHDGFRLSSLGSDPAVTKPFTTSLTVSFSAGPELIRCISQENGRDGFHLAPPTNDGIALPARATNAFTLIDCSATGNGRHGVRVHRDVGAVVVSGGTIAPGVGTVEMASAIYVEEASKKGACDSFIEVKPGTSDIATNTTVPRVRVIGTAVSPRPGKPRWNLPVPLCGAGPTAGAP